MSVESQQHAAKSWMVGSKMKKMCIFRTANYALVLLSLLMMQAGVFALLAYFAIALVECIYLWRIHDGDIKALRTYSTLAKIAQVLCGILVVLIVIAGAFTVSSAQQSNVSWLDMKVQLTQFDIKQELNTLSSVFSTPTQMVLVGFALVTAAYLLIWRYSYLYFKVFRTLSKMTVTETMPRKLPFGRMRLYEYIMIAFHILILINNLSMGTAFLVGNLASIAIGVCMVLYRWYFASLCKEIKQGCKTLFSQAEN